jgi:hypothetical protein
MKIPKLKPLIIELITETLFGKRLKLDFGPFFGGGLLNAVITKNTKPEKHYNYLDSLSLGNEKEEKYFPYKITWFDKEKIPKGHFALTYEELLYIIAKKQLSPSTTKRMRDSSQFVPKIKGPITEALPNEFALIVGIISMDAADIEAIKGGRFTSHKSLKMRQGYPWRYNELSDNLYWRQELPPDKHREMVKEIGRAHV